METKRDNIDTSKDLTTPNLPTEENDSTLNREGNTSSIPEAPKRKLLTENLSTDLSETP